MKLCASNCVSRLISIRSVCVCVCVRSKSHHFPHQNAAKLCRCTTRIATSKSLATTSSFFLFFFFQATIDSCQSVSHCERIWKREKKSLRVFYPWASFNSHPQLPACLCSFHLTVLFGRPSAPKWPYITLAWASIQGLHFLGDWLWKTFRRNPRMFPLCLREGRHCLRLWESCPVVWLSCWD